MPVECDIEIKRVGQDDFHQIDQVVMRQAFDIHNSMGRFCDERIYQDELAARCENSGLDSLREVRIRLFHGSFSKLYFIDMLIDQSVVYELKATASLCPGHQKQLINYLLLTDTGHGKLLNFRPSSVQSRFVSTTMSLRERMAYRLNAEKWNSEDKHGELLKNHLLEIIEDWGTCLDIVAYREALLHLTSEPGAGLIPVAIQNRGHTIGYQKMCLLTPDTAWHMSAVKSNLPAYEKHIRRLITHTTLNHLHWINLDQTQIQLNTIKIDSVAK